jgi:hypothetical protein
MFRCQLLHCNVNSTTDLNSFFLASYALFLNSTLTSLYICIGTFNGLVTFVGK